MEEVSAKVSPIGPWLNIDIMVDQDSKGEHIVFHHLARVRQAQLIEKANLEIYDEDVDGAYWLAIEDWRKRDDLSPLAQHAFEQFNL